MKKSGGGRPPRALSRSARAWYRKLTGEFDISDEAGRLLLLTAMHCLDRAEGARLQLDRDGTTVVDRWGQTKVHPLVNVERDARSGMLAALKALNLDIEPKRDRPGRPPGGRG